MVTRRISTHAAAVLVGLLASTAALRAEAQDPGPEAQEPGVEAQEPAPDAAPTPDPAAAPPAPRSNTPPEPAPSPVRLHHAPIASAEEGEDLVFRAGLDHPHLARAVTLVFRGADGAVRGVPFRRAEAGYLATIPADQMRGQVGYAIEVTTHDGSTVAVFASRAPMHPVQILSDAGEEREARLLARLGGRRSVATVSGEYADFGEQAGVNDAFWRTEGRYTYRPLKTIAEFWIRGGVMRGTTPATTIDDDGAGSIVESERGLNYGAPGMRLRLHDAWHLELEGMASISDEGFSTGGGFNLLVGDPYGSKLVLGAAFVGVGDSTYFGSKLTSRVDLAVHERVTASPIVEITDMPNAEQFGVRLLADVGVGFGGGFSANVHAGYQARVAASGGPALGGSASLAF